MHRHQDSLSRSLIKTPLKAEEGTNIEKNNCLLLLNSTDPHWSIEEGNAPGGE